MILFLLVAALAIASALVVILHPHPVYSALSLVVTLFQVAILFILLEAHMIAFLQVIVYAGAIMVLFLFVIMLLNLQREPADVSMRWKATVLAMGGLLAAELGIAFLTSPMPPAAEATEGSDYGSALSLSRALFTDHVFAFELASILLLVAIVGAVVLAKRRPR